MTLDYTFYQKIYHGRRLDEACFDGYMTRAAGQIARYCSNYTVAPAALLLERYSREELYGLAQCAVADVFYFYDQMQTTSEVQSASVGSVSYSLAKGQTPNTTTQAQAVMLYRAANRFLDIYRGG